MRNETIFYRAGKNTLIYFVMEESITGCRRNIKKRFWQKVKLSSFDVCEEELHIITVMIPQLQKGWKKEKLLRLMHETIAEKNMYSVDAEVVLKPEVQLMLGQEDTFPSIFWSLAGKQLDNMPFMKKAHGKRRGSCLETVVLLLGDTLFPEEQMQKFMEMMQPYLPLVNHLTILYEKGDDKDVNYDSGVTYKNTGSEQEQGQNRWEETLADYTEELYYEYGLVAYIQHGGDFRINRNSEMHGQNIMFFLDFGYSGNLPLRSLKAGDIYLDIFSDAKKETLFRRKCTEVSYISPRKYLDTVVKSGYDRLVNYALPT